MKLYQAVTFKYFDKSIECQLSALIHINNERYSVTTIGKSKCHESDKFNKRFGEILAESRASVKLAKSIQRLIKEQMKSLDKEVQYYCKNLDKANYLLFTEISHLNNLLDNGINSLNT